MTVASSAPRSSFRQPALASRPMSLPQRAPARTGARLPVPGLRRTRASVTPDAVRAAWARFQARTCGTRAGSKRAFGVTFQTACNWWSEANTPTGDKVILAAILFPAAFAALLREVA